MNSGTGTLPFTFLDSTAVTFASWDQGQQQLTRLVLPSQAKRNRQLTGWRFCAFFIAAALSTEPQC